MNTHGVDVTAATLEEILDLREEYRREMNCQIVHDSWHARGFTDSYLLWIDGHNVGHGAVGAAPGEPREIVKEFFVRPVARSMALPLFRRLVATSGARWVEAQTNDVLLTLMLFDCAQEVTSETVLFEDARTTDLPAPGVVLRRLVDEDRTRVFAHTLEPVGDWVLDQAGTIVATGGLFFHYNRPFGDLYMEVDAPHRRRGLGSYLVQELKRICYEVGSVPAARCHQDNVGSRVALQRAGLLPCARILKGRLVLAE